MQDKLGRKRVFTTGDIAKIMDVNINTVVKWFEEGLLKGYKLPGSTARRVPRSELIEFMLTRNVSLVYGPGETIDIVLVSSRSEMHDKLLRVVESAFGYRLRWALDSFEVGCLCAVRIPDIIIIDNKFADFNPDIFYKGANERPQFAETKILLIADVEIDDNELLKKGYSGQVKRSSWGNKILEAVDKVILNDKINIPKFTLSRD